MLSCGNSVSIASLCCLKDTWTDRVTEGKLGGSVNDTCNTKTVTKYNAKAKQGNGLIQE